MPSSIRQLRRGESCEAKIGPHFYTVTRSILGNDWAVWRDGADFPYYVGQEARTKWICDCPDSVYRRRTCKHIRLVRG